MTFLGRVLDIRASNVTMAMVDLEREHVHKVYSEIAAHFSDTRFKPWPRITQFLQQQPLGSLIADVGATFFFQVAS